VESPAAQREKSVRGGESYRYLAAALPRLAANPDDDHTRLIAAREYLKLGLLGPARSLLEKADEAMSENPEIAAIMDRLPAAPAVDTWSERTSRFEANLAALAGRDEIADQIRSEWLAAKANYELHTDAGKVDQVLYRGPGDQPKWLPSLEDHVLTAKTSAPPPDHQENMPGPYLFEGVGLGWFFERIWRTTRETFLGFSPALYIVERNAADFAVALHLHDWREILADERVMIFLGGGGNESLRDAILTDDEMPCPRYLFKLGLHASTNPTI
jgi:hypothetical protein